jgi:hypothetical protein
LHVSLILLAQSLPVYSHIHSCVHCAFAFLWSAEPLLLVLLLLSYVVHFTRRSCLLPICILSFVLCWLSRSQCLPLVLYLLFFVPHTRAVRITVADYSERLVGGAAVSLCICATRFKQNGWL